MKVNFTHYDANNKAYAESIGASKTKQLLWFMLGALLVRNPLIPFSVPSELASFDFGEIWVMYSVRCSPG